MRDYRSFFRGSRKDFGIHGLSLLKGAGDGPVKVAMFSNFFCDLSDNLFCTNNMYADLRDSIISSIDIYSPKAKIILDIYETKESDEDKRDFALIGFNKYIKACYAKHKKQFWIQFITISFFALIGLACIIFLYLIQPDIAEWIQVCIEVVGDVLLWQYVGYWAFEFVGQFLELKQLRQISEIEYKFHLWE